FHWTCGPTWPALAYHRRRRKLRRARYRRAVEQNYQIITALIAYYDIGLAIAIEIAYRHCDRMIAHCFVDRRLKVATRVPEKNRNLFSTIVRCDDVGCPIHVEVGSNQR